MSSCADSYFRSGSAAGLTFIVRSPLLVGGFERSKGNVVCPISRCGQRTLLVRDGRPDRRKGAVVRMAQTPPQRKKRPTDILPADPLPDDGAFLPIDLIDEDEIGPSKDPRRRERKRKKNEKPIGYREYIKKIRKCYKEWKKMRGTYGIQELLVKLSYGLNVDWRNSVNVKALRRKFREWRSRGGAPSEEEYKEAVKMVTDPTITQEQIELGHRVVEALQAVKTWQRTEKMPDMETLREILIDLAHCGAYKEIRQVIKEMLRQGREVDAEMFFCLIHACILGDHMEGAVATLKRMKSRKTIPPIYIYNYIIRAWAYSREQKYNRLIRTFEIEMKNRGLEPTLETYEIIFDGYAKTKNVTDAPRTWETMRRKRLDPTIECFNGFINCYAGNGDVLACQSLWTEMHQRGLEPNANTYAAMLRANANAGNFEEAIDWERQIVSEKSFGLSLRAHNAMVAAYVKVKDMNGAMQRYVEMRQSGVTPSLETYSLLISGFAEIADSERAVAVYRHVMERGINPDLETYNAVLKALSLDGRYEETKKLILRFRKGRRVVPDVYSLKYLIDACANARFIGGAKDAFHTTQMILQLRPTIVTWNAMLRAAAVCEDLESTQLFFKKLRKNKRSRENAESYNWVVVGYARARDFVGMKGILNEMTRLGHERNLESSKAMVKAFRAVDDLRLAADAFEEMLRQRIRPDVEICNEMIEMYLEHECLEDALNVFVEMQQLDVDPDRRTYNNLIKVQTQRRAIVEVLAVHDEMKLRKVSPDTETYCLRIEAFASMGDMYNAVGVFLETESISSTFQSNPTIYASLIAAHALNHQLEGAVETFERMKYRGIPANTEVFNAMIEAHSRCGEGKNALTVYRDMERRNIPVNEDTYDVVIRAHGRMKNMQAARRFYEELQLKGIEESTKIINALIFAHGEVDEADKALALLRKMLAREQVPGKKPSKESYQLVLDVFCRNGQQDVAEELWREMIDEKSLKPSRECFIAMMRGYSLTQEAARIREMMDQMRQYNRVIGEEPYAALIDSFCRVDDFQGAEEIKAELLESRFSPSTLSNNILIEAYGRSGDSAKALETFKDMSEQDVRPNEKSYELLLESCTRLENFEIVDEVVDLMRNDGNVRFTLVASAYYLESLRMREDYSKLDEEFTSIKDPDVLCWNQFLRSLYERNLVIGVVHNFLRMQTLRVEPNEETYEILVRTHLKEGDGNELVWSLRKWAESPYKVDVTTVNELMETLLQGGRKLDGYRVWQEASRWNGKINIDPKWEATVELTEEERLEMDVGLIKEKEELEKALHVHRVLQESS